MNKAINLLCAYCAIPFSILLALGFFMISGWFPPLQPSLDAGQIHAMYEERRMALRLGMTLMVFACGFWWPFCAAISMQMKRMEGKYSILSYVQMATATCTVMIVMLAGFFVLTAAYRPGLPAESVQMLTDIAWLMNIGAYPAGLFQNLAIGFCILYTAPSRAVYPRWLGYANLWLAVLYMPGALLPFFKTGPFAWNGIFGFWLVATAFFGWIALMCWYTAKAIRTAPEDGPDS